LERQPFQNPLYALPSAQYPTTPEDIFDAIAAEPSKYDLGSTTKFNTGVEKGQAPIVVSEWHAPSIM
jgi:hypothetical protein